MRRSSNHFTNVFFFDRPKVSCKPPQNGYRKGIMKNVLGLSICVVFLFLNAARADEAKNRFDGVWDTVISCGNTRGAMGYSYQFPSTVKNSILHGSKGTKGEPGWLQLDGTILLDGSAKIYASGLVGAREVAVGQRPPGTEYGYHIEANFSDATGTGNRVEGRRCTVTFTRH